ncbi:MAG: translation initiation factor IF-6 [Candidatus Micrarchaeota archaeon]
MHCGSSTYHGNTFLGAFGCSTDRVTFIGNAPQKLMDSCREILKTDIVHITINSSDLVGIFMSANSNGAIFPEFVSEEEVKLAKEAGLNTHILRGRMSAIGNNIIANDRVALVNPDIEKGELGKISDCLGVEAFQRSIAGYKTVGSTCVLTNKGFIIHNNAAEELKEIEEMIGLEGGIGTANMGVPFVGICMFANSNGYIAGKETGGFELHRIDEALGFIG